MIIRRLRIGFTERDKACGLRFCGLQDICADHFQGERKISMGSRTNGEKERKGVEGVRTKNALHMHETVTV